MRPGLAAAIVVLLSGGAVFAKSKVAILGVESVDNGDAKSRQKTGALARALTKAMRDRVVATDLGYEIAANSNKDLGELKLLSDCVDEGADCMAAIGKDLSVDLLVYGHVEKQKDGYLVTVQSLVVPSPRKAGPYSARRHYAFGNASEDEMKRLAEATLSNQPASETLLVVEVNAATGTVFVNGAAKGAIVNGTVTVKGLPPGPATVAVDSPGYERYEHGSVDVKPGATTRLSVELVKAVGKPVVTAPIPTAPAPEAERPGGTARVLFWTSLVATGAGVAAFTITGLKVRSIEDEQDQAIKEWGDGFKSNGVQFPGDACAEARNDHFQKLVDICDRGKSMATVTNVLIGVTAAAAVATAFFAWKGYLSSGSSGERVARRKDRPPRIVVSPELYSNGGGVGAVVQF
jgi:hypothetical protein